jgi:hypothetical protein
MVEAVPAPMETELSATGAVVKAIIKWDRIKRVESPFATLVVGIADGRKSTRVI